MNFLRLSFYRSMHFVMPGIGLHMVRLLAFSHSFRINLFFLKLFIYFTLHLGKMLLRIKQLRPLKPSRKHHELSNGESRREGF